MKEDERGGQGHTYTSGKIDQCVCIKFCVKLSKYTTKTLKMLCDDFGEHSLSRTAVFEWHSCFKGWLSVS
jgi:hypothetical protein